MTHSSLFETQKEISSQFDEASQIVLFHGDTSDFSDTLPDETVKLIIASPPYN